VHRGPRARSGRDPLSARRRRAAVAERFDSECDGEVRLARADRTREDHVVAASDPLASREVQLPHAQPFGEHPVTNDVNLIHGQHRPAGLPRDVVPGGSVSERRLDLFLAGAISSPSERVPDTADCVTRILLRRTATVRVNKALIARS
jgi:hypothetical protein